MIVDASLLRTCLALLGTLAVVCSHAQALEVTVCPEGSGDYTTLQAAIAAVPTGRPESKVTIRVRPGTYRELIYIQREKRHLNIIGESADTVRITYDLHAHMTGLDGNSIGTFRTPTMVVDADDISFRNLTIENSAGPVGQALALRVDGDRVEFRDCRFLGWQDTIFLNRGRQYFENCYIAGSTDFIFGGATAYFLNCHLHSLRSSYITAASTPLEQPFGFVFDRCRITVAADDIQLYLGRPWRDYSAVVFMRTEMPAAIRSAGWHNWSKPEREKTVRYYEFGNTGPGAATEGRVEWAVQGQIEEANHIHPRSVLVGHDGWAPVVAKQPLQGE